MVVLYTQEDSKQTVTVPDFSGMTISQANAEAANYNLNIEIGGNNLTSSGVVAYNQSIEPNTNAEIGTVITVKFKSTASVLD